MNVRQLIEDDDAVSPVIGVILMVAITVILAAVIATFVLGLGDQVGDSGPQVSITFQWDGQTGEDADLKVTHNNGQSVEAGNIYFRGDAGSVTGANDTDLNQNWASRVGEMDSTSKVKAGMSADLRGIGSDGEVNVVWESNSGDSSATLNTWEGPTA